MIYYKYYFGENYWYQICSFSEQIIIYNYKAKQTWFFFLHSKVASIDEH